MGGALGEQFQEAPGLGLDLGSGDRHRVAGDPAGPAHQEFQAIGEQDGVDHRGVGIDALDGARRGLEFGRAAVAEIIAQLGGLPVFDHFPGFGEKRLIGLALLLGASSQ